MASSFSTSQPRACHSAQCPSAVACCSASDAFNLTFEGELFPMLFSPIIEGENERDTFQRGRPFCSQIIHF